HAEAQFLRVKRHRPILVHHRQLRETHVHDLSTPLLLKFAPAPRPLGPAPTGCAHGRTDDQIIHIRVFYVLQKLRAAPATPRWARQRAATPGMTPMRAAAPGATARRMGCAFRLVLELTTCPVCNGPVERAENARNWA